ncbi:pilus assembly protein [Aquipseudomonas guryensis]|jgi:type IV pilus assembly protein PilY1|uniref:Pilus assembly protein PilY n=1 Tax=Aquipseudomonas guryensis TaxID=2759165 RepID=A0A7W4DBF7_9GAMM|nr:PilC/PilY family type IV pilus protein [Pseudomonas guryensis]MBB1519529.1 pilus assembly protein PilY [Pseudomonas guryensis]
MKSLFGWVSLVVGMGISSAALAEDIDLFVSNPPTGADAPNVLIVLDTTANWSQAYANEKAALASVISGMPVNTFRVGLLMFTETGSGNSGNDGAYVRAAIRTMDTANKATYQNLVNSLDKLDDKGNGAKLAKAMEESYLYFSAGVPHAGNNKVKADYLGNTSGTAASQAIYALAANALNSKAGTQYNNPIVTGCAKNFIIYISNGPATDNNSDKTQANTALAAAGGSTAAIAISPSGLQDNPADEWSRFMKKSALGITTYTVEIDRGTTGQGPNMTALLQSVSRVSSGKYFSVSSNASEIVNALNSILSEIQSVNSVFASVSLPVSVNTQGTYLNQVYVGMFRPDADGLPRWMGNLKQYKLGLVNTDLRLLDADDNSAINASSGFVTECARSFWTPSAADNYWGFAPRGECLTVTDSGNSNSPDGNIVEKGAQAYRLRNDTGRTVKTCSPTFASCTSLTNFNNANTAITQGLLGAANATERTNMINWAVGQDLQNENGDLVSGNPNTSDTRASVHGDVVHSRPVAINYGTDASPDVVVFYGGNDGLLRAVNGDRDGSFGGYAAGREIWSFMAPEFYGSIKRIYDNSVSISYPGTTVTTPAPLPKPYGFDGPVTAIKESSSAWLYATMRRGGRALYAFDVSNPAAPSLKWKKGCPNNFPTSGAVDDTGCTTGFSGIGQTWSSPKALKSAGYGAGASNMLIMGGGYDTCEDGDPNTCTAASKGNKIYVLDADTGALLQTFTTDRGVIADVTIVPDSSGKAIYAYAVDLGGNLYRITIGNLAPASWSMTKLASLGCDTTASCTNNRKFMFAPDVVSDAGGYLVLMGSGDREKPLLSYTGAASVSNHFFMVKDQPADATWLTSESGTCGSAVICRNSLLPILTDATPSAADLAAKKGWYLGMTSTEQVVTSAITVFGLVTFSTHQPAVATPGLCSSLGESRVYNIGYEDAEGPDGIRFADLAGDGLPPSPVAGMVTLDDGTTVPFVIGANPDSPLEGSPPVTPPSLTQPTSRVYWNIEQ